eukprot:3641083-Prymnesium_polylepis.1
MTREFRGGRAGGRNANASAGRALTTHRGGKQAYSSLCLTSLTLFTERGQTPRGGGSMSKQPGPAAAPSGPVAVKPVGS